MEVILLEKIENLGGLGDCVAVKAGYGRNYLIPKGKATEATSENIARFEARRVELEKASANAQAQAQVRSEQLADVVVTLTVKAGNEGRLYGSVGPADIADAVSTAGFELKKHEVRMPDGPLRQVGEYAVNVQLHADVKTQVQVNIEPV